MAANITDDFMRDMRSRAKSYSVMILKKGPNYEQDAEKRIIWEHARRNYELRADGVLPIVCPILDDTEYAGIGILNCSAAEAAEIMRHDPAVKAGVLTVDIHPSRGLPGDTLPA